MTTKTTMSPVKPKPGEAYILGGTGYSDGKRRDVRVVLDNKEIDRFATTSGLFTRNYPGLPAGPHIIEANSTVGCSSISFTVDPVVVTPPPIDPPPTTPGIPAIPPGWGSLFLKNFADNKLDPFRILTYPNTHEGDADLMLGFIEYGHPEKGRYLTQKYVTDQITIKDGIADMLCRLDPASGIWLASFMGTFDISGAGSFTKSFTPPFRVRWCLDLGGKAGRADWRGAWVYGTWKNKNLEVPDFPEIIGGKVTANLHGGPSGDKASIGSFAIPPGFAIYESLVLPNNVAVSIDGGTPKAKGWQVSGPLGLFLDSKVGLDYPDATTGSPRLRVAWVTVDPA